MKGLIVLMVIVVISPLLLVPQEAKTVYIPEDITVDENALKAIQISNLSEMEIYKTGPTTLLDDFIYLLDSQNNRIVKLSLQGKIAGQFGKKGAGPGEFLTLLGVNAFKENIAVFDRNKVVICDKDLELLREIKLEQMFKGLIPAGNQKIYFYNNPFYSNYYFTVYSEDFKPLKKFGIKDPNAEEKKITEKNHTPSWDIVHTTLYVPGENSIWVSFRNRYDFRCYKDEKVVVDIKSKKPMFASREDEFSGKKITIYSDYSILIAKHGNQLYYCYKQGQDLFCDVFNLTENYRLQRRLKFPFRYKQLVLFDGSTFYGLRYGAEGENVFLDKVEIIK